MSFNNSAGVYPVLTDKSFSVAQSGIVSGGIVVTASRGTTEVNTVTSISQLRRQYGNADRSNPSLYAAERFLRRANVLSVRRVINDATKATGANAAGSFTFTAENEGTWANNITITFEDVSANEGAGVIRVFVNELGTEVERFLVSRSMGAKDGYGNALYIEDVINEQSEYIRVVDDPEIVTAIDFDETVALSGGTDDTAAVTSGSIVSAWDEFANANAVSATLLINAGFTAQEVQVKMLAVAEERKDAFAILDVPEADNDDPQAMINHRNTVLGADTHLGAIYGGWVRIYDAVNDLRVAIPPSGDVAGIFNYTVEVAERWNAPAGLQRGIIPDCLGVTRQFTEGELDLLYTNGVNPITNINGNSAVVWGSKTLQKQTSALSDINVVNLLVWANVRMAESLQPFVFQNNTTQTRESVNFLLTSFWENIKQRDGVYDFYVDTSEELNTAAVIDANQMLVDVYVKPTRTAYYIRLNTIVSSTGVEFG